MSVGQVSSSAASARSVDLGQTSTEQARIDRAMQFFMDKGWTRAQAAGIVGNLWGESRVKHDQAQHGGGPGYGLAQWEGPRQASFAQWAGHSIHNSTMQEQLEFIHWELNNTESAAGRRLRSADTADEAARVVMTRYERPADQSEGAQRRRAGYAQEIYEGAGGSPGNTGPGPEEPGPGNGNGNGNGGTYTVRSGDTLSGIASRHGVSLSALLAANPQINNPNVIHPGQTVRIPGGDSGGGNTGGRAHDVTVRSGDTLSGIAARNGVSLNALIAANPQIRNPNVIHPGQTIHIPGSGGGDSGGGARTHDVTVRSGDTLSGIAARNGVSLNALIAANPQIRNPNVIHPGQVVHVPGSGGSGSNPAPAPTTHNYTVHSGDTLSGIAARNGTTVGALLAANPQIRDANVIHAGQVIKIPGPGGGNGPTGPTGPAPGGNGSRAADIADNFLGRNASELKRSGDLPMNPNVPNNVCCANFVSAVLQQAGLMRGHTDLVSGSNRDGSGNPAALGNMLIAQGWRVVPASQARPGDVAIVNNGHHVELVHSNNNGTIRLIGSNNVNADGSQRISWGNPYGNAWYLSPP